MLPIFALVVVDKCFANNLCEYISVLASHFHIIKNILRKVALNMPQLSEVLKAYCFTGALVRIAAVAPAVPPANANIDS